LYESIVVNVFSIIGEDEREPTLKATERESYLLRFRSQDIDGSVDARCQYSTIAPAA
jgi:hypothetical protein